MPMTAGTRLKKTLKTALAGVALLAFSPEVALSDSSFPAEVRANPVGATTKQVSLGISKSLVVELPRGATDVMVSDPETADAVMRSARRAYVIGRKVGQTNIFFFDERGQQILNLKVAVERDIGVLEDTIRTLVPGSDIRVKPMNDNVILSGTARSPADAKSAEDIAARFIGEPENVLNMIAVHSDDQVYLQVTVAEVSRNVVKQLGLNLAGQNGSTNAQFGIVTDNTFPVSAQSSISGGTTATGLFQDGCTLATGAVGGSISAASLGDPACSFLSATLQALERKGLVRTLAEPTLTAISGEAASFLAGGEFPVPVAADNGEVTIEFKPFGVGLAFTPVVMSEGRISLRVQTEVSQLTSEGAIPISIGVNTTATIPGLEVRRADTTVELPSGGSIVLAGLISEDTRQNLDGVPGIMNLPVLGALFKSRDFVSSETELMVIATPYLVRPVSREQLALPTDGVQPASDPSAILLGRLNRIYSPNGYLPPRGEYRGNYGFIYD